MASEVLHLIALHHIFLIENNISLQMVMLLTTLIFVVESPKDPYLGHFYS